MTTSLSAFTSRIAYRVDGCPDITIEQTVLDSCIEFCEKTLILKQTLDSATVTAGTAEVELDTPSSTKLVKILRVWLDETELAAASEDDVGNPLVHVDSITGVAGVSARPRFYVESSPGVLRLFPKPDDTYTLTVRAAVKPSRSSTAVDEILFENWAAGIVDGALSRLYAMPERWANPGLAAACTNNFNAAVSAALSELYLGRARGDMRITPVRI